MIDEQELIDLMTKSGEAYFKNKTDEGNLYAKELIHKLDFSQRRDQEVLFQVLGNALIRNDEICILDELHAAGFDFGMVFERGITLTQFFAKYPKFSTDNRVFEKIAEYGDSSSLNTACAEALSRVLEENPYTYNLWWKCSERFYSPRCKVASEELNADILKRTKSISTKDAEKPNKNGLTILHELVMHNYYEAAEILLKNGANPNVLGTKGDDRDFDYTDITPLHLACYMGNCKMVKLLVDHGADTTLRDTQGRNAFHYLVYFYYENVQNNVTGQRESITQRLDILPLLHCDINARDNEGMTPLLWLMHSWTAASQKLTEPLVKNGADVFATDSNGNTPLMIAAQNGLITASMFLIPLSDINYQNNDGDTVLHLAAKKYCYPLMQVLLDSGADASVANKKGETLDSFIQDDFGEDFREYLKRGRYDPPRELARHIHNNFVQCSGDNTDNFPYALYLTDKFLKEIDKDDDEEVSYISDIVYSGLEADENGILLKKIYDEGFDFTMPIIKYGVTTNIRDSCLHENIGIKAIRQLMELGVDMNTAFVNGKTPANIVADLQKVDSWFSRDNETDYHAEAAQNFSRESMEERNDNGFSAVHLAAKNDHIGMMRVMIEKGVDVNITADVPQKETDLTPLHIACKHGNSKIVKLLKEAGADDSLTTSFGETPAHYVVSKKESYIEISDEKRAEMLKLLDDVDTPRDDGKTPLLLLQKLHSSVIKVLLPILLEKGANVNHADNGGNTSLLLYVDENYDRDIVKELIRAGADVNARNSQGNTALHYAIKNHQINIARFLIKKGANYEIANNNGETPVSLAAERGLQAVLELMV